MTTNPLVDALLALYEVSCRVRALLQETPALQGREHDSLGDRFNKALGDAARALTAPPPDGVVVPDGWAVVPTIELDRARVMLERWHRRGTTLHSDAFQEAAFDILRRMLSAAPPAMPAPQPEVASEALHGTDPAMLRHVDAATVAAMDAALAIPPSEAVEPVAWQYRIAMRTGTWAWSMWFDPITDKSAFDAVVACQRDAGNECETRALYTTPPPATTRAGVTEAMVEALRDFADHGLRFDLNPSHDLSSRDSSEEFWHAYAQRMDASVRQRAREALSHTPPLVSDADLAVLDMLTDDGMLSDGEREACARILAALTQGRGT